MKFTDRLKQRILLGDGAIGTMLQKLGLQVGDCPELWNAAEPGKVRKISQLYAQAGAEVLTTNTFGGSVLKLKQNNLADQTEELNRLGAFYAREVAGDKLFVAGSMGPTGEFLAPLGVVTEAGMKDSFARQAVGLQKGQVDFVQIETMSDLKEAALAVLAVRENTDLPVVVSLTFVKGKTGYRTVMGVDVKKIVELFESLGVDVIGTNCGNGIDEIIEIVHEMHSFTRLPIFAAANAGIPKLVNGETKYSQDGDYFARRLNSLIGAGATYIAGCCGTAPDHIRKMANVLANR